MKVSFLGLGQMGRYMAINILKAGFDLTVWNRKDDFWCNVEELVSKGAKAANTIEEAVVDADVVCISLTGDHAVSHVVKQFINRLKEEALIIDFSTTSPSCAREMAELASKYNVYFIDAPVSGGVKGAEDGTLTVMAGGKEQSFLKAEPILKAVSSHYHYMGLNGSGQTTKLINQLLTGANQAVVCEAMLLAEKASLDLEKLYNVLSTSWGNSRMLERSVLQYIIPRNYESAACLELMVKDLEFTLKLAEDLGCSLELAKAAESYYKKAKDLGMGKQDHSAIIEAMRKCNQ